MVCHYYGGKDLIKRIEDVILTVDVVFDTYPQVVAKFITQFLKGRRRFEVEKRQVKKRGFKSRVPMYWQTDE